MSAAYQWGGLLQQSGYPTGALIGEDIRFARLLYYQRLARWSLLEGVYGAFSLEVGRVGRPLIPNNEQGTLRSAAVMLGVDTPIGPLYLGYGRSNTATKACTCFLGGHSLGCELCGVALHGQGPRFAESSAVPEHGTAGLGSLPRLDYASSRCG